MDKPPLSIILIVIGVALLVLGTGFSPQMMAIAGFEASVGDLEIGASAEGITPVQAGSFIAGAFLVIVGVYLRSKGQ